MLRGVQRRGIREQNRPSACLHWILFALPEGARQVAETTSRVCQQTGQTPLWSLKCFLLRAGVSDVVFVLFSLFIIDFYPPNMAKTSPVSVFLAATSLLIASASSGVVAQAQSAGGLQEWSTDQAVDAESIPDSDAKALKKKAIAEDVCVPIGEGENCW